MNELYRAENDPQFQKPYIDVDEWRDSPIRHHYIHGGFEGTLTRFVMYFPEKENYRGRFFQHISPFVGDECEAQCQDPETSRIRFAVSHGAYLLESNLGGIVNGGDDPTLMYRASANAAQFSRKIACEYYGEHRPYGYCYGGSGGAFKTTSCIENTEGIWDGAVPFVTGSPMAMPNVFTARVHAMRLLRNKMPQVVDAIEPGGSGDPYACLNEEEADALREASLMGFPMKTWCVWDTIGDGALPVLTPAVEAMDPVYYKDFWEKPGYLGTVEDGSAIRDRIMADTKITEILSPEGILKGIADSIDEQNAYGVDEAWKNAMNKATALPHFRLDYTASEDAYLRGLKLHFKSGKLAGETFAALWVKENIYTVDNGMDQRDLPALLSNAAVGDLVTLDNSDYIAIQTLHRHQVPGPEYHVWDQFRDEQGFPIYPQRPSLISPVIAMQGCGSVQNGKPTKKVIVLESMMDESAFPWQADWYRREVEKNFGSETDSRFRLWYMENCMHTDCEEGNGGDHQHIVSYAGALNQALLDLSDWVEKGIEPPATSNYTLDGGQVLVPGNAEERKGIQPTAELTINGEKCYIAEPGEKVTFTAKGELPEGTGRIETVNWDFEATGDFLPEGSIAMEADGRKVTAVAEHVFYESGTYFPVVKIAGNRTLGDPFTMVWNQDRVRVVVKNGKE